MNINQVMIFDDRILKTQKFKIKFRLNISIIFILNNLIDDFVLMFPKGKETHLLSNLAYTLIEDFAIKLNKKLLLLTADYKEYIKFTLSMKEAILLYIVLRNENLINYGQYEKNELQTIINQIHQKYL